MMPKDEHEWTVHALNIHGAFFERWTATILAKQPGWRVRSTNYPVRMPPDPAVVGKESAVDVIAQWPGGQVLITLVVECKKNNPDFVNWIFFKSQTYPQLTVSALAHGDFDRDEPPDWYLVRRLIASSMPAADEARETRGNYAEHRRGDKTRTANSAITDAAYQAALGLQGLISEELYRARSLQDSEGHFSSQEWNDQVFVPVIVTTANLKLATFEPGDVSPATGEIDFAAVKFEDLPYLVYDYPLPRHLHAGDVRVDQLRTEESANLWSRLQLVIVNSQRISDFLNSDLMNEIGGRAYRGLTTS